MKCNVGGMDMTVRLIAGLVLLVIGLTIPMNAIVQVIVFVVAAIALITGIIRYCPANALFGINTCAKQGQGPQGGTGHSRPGAGESHGPAR